MFDLSQTCPTYFEGEPIVVENSPEDCVCMPCEQLIVTMFIRVVDRWNEPIQLANVTTEVGSYLTDLDGVAGFEVFASAHDCGIHITAVGYERFEKSIHVVPGEVNVDFVTLFDVMSVTVYPPASSFMISMATLKITELFNVSSSTEFADLERAPNEFEAECFVFFPAGVFDSNALYTFLMSPFNMREVENLEYRAQKSFVTIHNNPVFAAAVGYLKVIDSDGNLFQFPSNEMLAISLTLHERANFSIFEIDQFQLYSQTADSKYTVLSDTPHTHTHRAPSGEYLRVAFEFSTPSEFQISFIIGFTDEACQVKVFAFDTVGMWERDGELSTHVMLSALLHQKAAMFVNINTSDGCMLIPCQGELSVEVLDNRRYESQVLDFSIEHELISGNGPIYFNHQDCVGFTTIQITKRQSDDDAFISFTLTNETFPPLAPLNPTLPISLNLTYCSISIGVAICSEDDVEVRASSEDGVIQVEQLTGAYHGLDDQGSGYSCTQIQRVCSVFVCGSQMMVEVRKLSQNASSSSTETEFCTPTTTLFNAALNRRKRQQTTLVSSEGYAFELLAGSEGVFDYPGLPYVALQKCIVLDIGTVVDFQCEDGDETMMAV